MTMKFKRKKLALAVSICTVIFTLLFSTTVHAVNIFPFGEIGWEGTPQDMSVSMQIMLVLTILSLAPSILIMMTSFTRTVIVISFVKNALGTQNAPPTQVVVGLSLFITFFVMSPVIEDIKVNAYEPYVAEQITQQEAIENAKVPIRDFMLRQTYTKDLNLFLEMGNREQPEKIEDISFDVIIPAFIISELKRAFQIGFFIYIPFVVIDMVVSSTLMAMGMMMLPPSMISLPFKLMLFVLVDGWDLVVQTIVTSFG